MLFVWNCPRAYSPAPGAANAFVHEPGKRRLAETFCDRGCVMIEIVQFAALVLTSLCMGVHFGTWLTEAPLRETRSGALFTEVHQGRDRVAARVMPILGNAAILVAACVVLARAVPGAFALSLAALVLI